ILTDVYCDEPAIILKCRPRLENRHRLLDVGNEQTDVVLNTHLLTVRRLRVKHELEIILSVGHSHIYPTQFRARRTASPEFLEAQDVAIEFHRRVQSGHQYSGMGHLR